MLPILPQIVRYREQEGVRFNLVLPNKSENLFLASLNDLFSSTNWAHFIQPERFEAVSESGDKVPVRRFMTDREMYAAVDELLRFFLRGSRISRETLQALEWSLTEIADNVLNHAQSSVGGFLQASEYGPAIEFVVADAGIGIPRSLGIDDQQEALRKAVSEGGTRDRSSNAGNGLYGSLRIAAISTGEFEMHSQGAVLSFDGQSAQEITTLDPTLLSGTSVRCAVGGFDGQLLEQALRFNGEPHQPLGDYVERTFETDSGELYYSINEHAKRDLGSRRGGARVRQELRNLLRDQDHVVLDFANVRVISSSFADEVFGRLFVDLGPRAFMSRIVLRNVDPTIDGLIDRAIVQRTKLGNPATP